MAQTHYLSFDATGYIVGYAPGHWTTDWEGEDPTEDSPPAPLGSHARNVRDYLLGPDSPGTAIGLIEFTCACDALDADCPHVQERVADYYVADPEGTPALTAKPALTILVDDVSHDPNDPTEIEKTPGASVTLKLQAAVPDDTAVTLKRSGAALYGSDPVLTFDSGETNEVTLTAPAQGLVGELVARTLLVQPTIVRILGWA